jgi:hypothetical protein
MACDFTDLSAHLSCVVIEIIALKFIAISTARFLDHAKRYSRIENFHHFDTLHESVLSNDTIQVKSD